ncbi:hypothetical protein [Limosilactobacillus vaginalis]|uniref:hypothetical protein n=1 Tax=Limosilactobacillus vaginalis TaxID=1633 RepID=UPI002359AAA5|nr:hypothetical protein [Limosilactobacillus vaginalis]WCT58853.1 hypothetical protein PRK59_07705 [Limosilactobacillus vaginalis]
MNKQNKKISNKKIFFEIENLPELEKLLQTAAEQSKQLQKTMHKLHQLKLVIKSQFGE